MQAQCNQQTALSQTNAGRKLVWVRVTEYNHNLGSTTSYASWLNFNKIQWESSLAIIAWCRMPKNAWRKVVVTEQQEYHFIRHQASDLFVVYSSSPMYSLHCIHAFSTLCFKHENEAATMSKHRGRQNCIKGQTRHATTADRRSMVPVCLHFIGFLKSF